MMSWFIIGVIALYFIHLFVKYVYKPYMRMQSFKGLKNVYLLPFMPLIGAFGLAEKSFKEKGD